MFFLGFFCSFTSAAPLNCVCRCEIFIEFLYSEWKRSRLVFSSSLCRCVQVFPDLHVRSSKQTETGTEGTYGGSRWMETNPFSNQEKKNKTKQSKQTFPKRETILLNKGYFSPGCGHKEVCTFLS